MALMWTGLGKIHMFLSTWKSLWFYRSFPKTGGFGNNAEKPGGAQKHHDAVWGRGKQTGFEMRQTTLVYTHWILV